MEMNTKDVHTKLVLAFLSFWIFLANAIVTGQYSSYLPESSYSSPSLPSSSSSYGSENRNYYDYSSESNSATDDYSKDSYQHQQFQYGGGDFDDEDSYNQPHHHQQAQTNYQPDYLNEHIFPFRQNQVRDSYGRPYSNHQSADLGPDLSSSSLMSYDNIGVNRSELIEYQAAAADEVKYPPLNSESQQHHQHQHQQQQQHHQQPLTKQQHLRAAHYLPTNNYLSPPSASGRLNSLSPYLADDGEKVSATFKDNTAYSNTEALMMMLNMSIPPPSPPPPVKPLYQSNAHGQRNVRTYLLGEEPYQQQHHHQLDPIQHSIPKDNKVETHFESPFSNNASHLSQTFFVGDDSDLSSSNSYHHPDQLQLDAHTLSLLQKYLAQHQHVVSSAQPVPAPFQLGNTIPISKHIEITKHVPVPVYRQVHVPFRKTVRIEIPRPVISTYPRPYPIKIPTVTKTVAVPMVKEVKIPIEKVMPYPVENRVPYIVQKRVPFEVEKQIAVPKYYPFPVKVPMVKTILHKKKQAHLLQHHPSLLEYFPRHHK